MRTMQIDNKKKMLKPALRTNADRSSSGTRSNEGHNTAFGADVFPFLTSPCAYNYRIFPFFNLVIYLLFTILLLCMKPVLPSFVTTFHQLLLVSKTRIELPEGTC